MNADIYLASEAKRLETLRQLETLRFYVQLAQIKQGDRS